MQLDKYSHIYFLGVGGIGMSALARYFKACGKTVSGYDKTRTQLTDELSGEGISIHFEESIKIFLRECPDSSTTLVIYTPAIPSDHNELVYARSNGFNLMKRSEVLGLISKMARTIAVAGTHGKTTTSSIITQVFHHNRLHVSAFLGGIAKNIDSNLLLDEDLLNKKNEEQWIIAEADEYDRSFLKLYPYIGVITSLDADHLDIYGTREEMVRNYNEFANQVSGKLFVKKGLAIQAPHQTYGIEDKADFWGHNLRVIDYNYVFDCETPQGVMKDMMLGLPGHHNVENAVVAIAVSLAAGLSETQIRDGLAQYLGVRRRFDYQVRNKKLIYLDDYAHHPAELKACISSIKEIYPDKKVTGIFQPHLFSRTRDFADGFAESLSLLDRLILMDIYPAREKPIPGVNSQMILEKVKIKDKAILSRQEIMKEMERTTPEVLLTLGAGDIDQLVKPLKTLFE